MNKIVEGKILSKCNKTSQIEYMYIHVIERGDISPSTFWRPSSCTVYNQIYKS